HSPLTTHHSLLFAHGTASRAGPTHRPADLPTSMSGRHVHCVTSGAKPAFAAESGHPSAVGAAGLPHSNDDRQHHRPIRTKSAAGEPLALAPEPGALGGHR